MRRNAAYGSRSYNWDREAVREVYRQARELTQSTGVPHEVDHEIPLHGKTVSGLHVSWNLRVRTMSENRSKGNAEYTDTI